MAVVLRDSVSCADKSEPASTAVPAMLAPNTVPVDHAASQVPAVSETASQAASAAPAVETRGNSGIIKIKQALGPKTLDLTRSTNGLMRAASRAAPHAAAGRLAASELAGKTGVTGARAKGGAALAPVLSARVNPGLSNAGSIAPAPVQSAGANSGNGSANSGHGKGKGGGK